MKRRVLVPLAVVALACLLWFWPSMGDDPRPDFGSDVEACKQNLTAIHDGLLRYRERFGRAPQGSGVAFFAELIASGVWEDTPENRARLTCPGKNAAPVPEGTDYADLDSLTGASSAYAGRNSAEFPLLKFPAGGAELEALVACDGSRGMNHDGVLNVLRSDGSIATLSVEQELERGRIPPGSTAIPVGKGSPIPELTKLTGD